jgi:hypothetical protein
MDHVSPTSSDLGQPSCSTVCRIVHELCKAVQQCKILYPGHDLQLGRCWPLKIILLASRTRWRPVKPAAELKSPSCPQKTGQLDQDMHAAAASHGLIRCKRGGTLLGHAQVLGHRRHAQTLLVIVATARLVRERDCVSLQLQGEVHPLCCWLC